MPANFKINGRSVENLDIDPMTPLLWVIRDELNLKGTKYSCGKSLCGACSVHVDGELVRSCSFPVNLAEGSEVTTIEGLSPDEAALHPVQQAWIEENVLQCGYCQPGFMMAAAKLLERIPNPTDQEIKDSITNICRCGTQPRIIKAIKRAAQLNLSQETTPKTNIR